MLGAYLITDNIILILVINLALLILLLFKHKSSPPILFFVLFISSYIFPFILNFIFDEKIAYYTEFDKNSLYEKVLIVNTLFLALLLFIRKVDSDFFDNNKSNINLFYFPLLICIAMDIYGFFKIILNFSNIERAGLGSIFEYFIMFATITSIYAKKRKQKILLTIVIIIYCFLNLIIEGRIETLQCILLLSIMYYKNLSTTKVIMFAIVGFILLSIMGNIRNEGSIDSLIYNKRINNYGEEYVLSNQGDVVYSSAALHGLIDSKILTNSERLISFKEYTKRLILPSNYVDELGILARYTQIFTPTGGGGLISSYLFTWFSYLFIPLVYFSINIMNKIMYRSKYSVLIVSIVLVTVPRWYAYDPITLIKMPLYGSIFLFLLNMIMRPRKAQKALEERYV